MSSLKMTFSLTSLILIFALAFAAMPVLAETGGLVPAITVYDGKVSAATNAVDHTQTRAAYWLKVSFDSPVADLIATDFEVNKADSINDAFTSITGSTLIDSFVTAEVGKVYILQIDLGDTSYEAGYVSVVLPEDAARGNSGANNKLTRRGEFTTSSLPKATDWTVTPALDASTFKAADDIDGKNFKAGSGGTTDDTGFTVNFTFTPGTLSAGVPTLVAAQVQLKDKDGKDVSTDSSGTNYATVNVGTAVGNTYPVEFTFTGEVPHPVVIGVNPQWATGTTTVQVPKAGVTENPPAAMITVTGLNETERTFRIEVGFTPAAKSDGSAGSAIKGFDEAGLDVKDAGDSVVLVTVEAEREADNSYVAILKYDQLATLPLTIKIKQSGDGSVKTSNPDHSAMVGGPPVITPPPANAPAKPDAPMAATNATNDLIIDVSWTAPADNGSAITGYTVKKYDSAGMLVKTFPDDDPATTA
ncbi:hypothetical protein C6499_14250, partial [Candidatus Poribacteria bacterium]